VKSSSSYDSIVSAYSSISKKSDSMTVILVNRGPTTQSAQVVLSGFSPSGSGTSLQLANLTGETFVSRTQNALQKGTVTVTNGGYSMSLPAYSVTACVFVSKSGSVGLADAIPVRPGKVRIVRTATGLDLSEGPDKGVVELRDPAGTVIARSLWNAGRAHFENSKIPNGMAIVTWDGGGRMMSVPTR
jgi:hypothetical protein